MSRTIKKKYTKSKAFDRSCRNHGNCSWCKKNRLYKNLKRMFNFKKEIYNGF